MVANWIRTLKSIPQTFTGKISARHYMMKWATPIKNLDSVLLKRNLPALQLPEDQQTADCFQVWMMCWVHCAWKLKATKLQAGKKRKTVYPWNTLHTRRGHGFIKKENQITTDKNGLLAAHTGFGVLDKHLKSKSGEKLRISQPFFILPNWGDTF